MRLIIVILFFISCKISDTASENQSVEENIDFLQTEDVQLTSPIVHIDSTVFLYSSMIYFDSNDDFNIYYQLDSQVFKRYSQPIEVDESSMLNFYSSQPNYVNSDTSSNQLLKALNLQDRATLELTPLAHMNYPGGGAISLLDLKTGSTNFREGLAWSGFQNEEINLVFNFKSPLQIEQMSFSLLSDHSSWIFLPSKIIAWENEEVLALLQTSAPKLNDHTAVKVLRMNLPKKKYSNLKIRIVNMKSIPDWHPGKGTKPWLFIDEVIAE